MQCTTAAHETRDGCSLGLFDGASIVGREDLSGQFEAPCKPPGLDPGSTAAMSVEGLL